MTVDPAAFADELASMRRGQAARHPELPKRLGPQTRYLCRITDNDDAPSARRKLAGRIGALLTDQPRSTQRIVLAALALLREAEHDDLTTRMRWLAGELNCHERTVRRRVDEAFDNLVRLAAERPGTRDDTAAADAWQLQSIRALLILDRPSAELTELRTVQIMRDGVGEIVTSFSLPRPVRTIATSHELGAKVIYGGRIRKVTRPTEEQFRYVVEFPGTYRRGDLHEYGIQFSIPPDQQMVPHYALVPLLTVRSLDLTIRFDRTRPPPAVWRLDGVPPQMVDAVDKDGDLIPLDKFGEVRLAFRRLHRGLGYGANWRPSGR